MQLIQTVPRQLSDGEKGPGAPATDDPAAPPRSQSGTRRTRRPAQVPGPTRHVRSLIFAAALASGLGSPIAEPAGAAELSGAPDMPTTEAPAELVIRGAQVITMNPARPQASAVAVRSGIIVYVGDDLGVQAYVGPHTRVLSGAGAHAATSAGAPTAGAAGEATHELTVLPGLIDAHAHLIGLGLALGQLELRGLRSPEAVIAAVQAAVAKGRDKAAAKPAEWLQGRGWDQNLFTPARFPGAAERQKLDEASGRRPVFLRRIDGHAGWANSEALLRAGINPRTPEVAGGRILRDERGEPTGVLIDNAMSLVEQVIPAPDAADLEQAILAAGAYVTARGLTAVHEMGIGPAAVAVYRRLAEEDRLPLRVYAFHDDPIPHGLAQLPYSLAYKAELQRLSERLGPPETRGRFSLRGIKLYMDGALGSRGAALWEPYSDDANQRGLLLCPAEHIEEMARWALLHGYQVATHAIGDRANQLVLDAYERAGVRESRNARFRVEHAQVLTPSDLLRRRYQTLGVIASVQPTHATSDMEWAPARLGPTRLTSAYAWQSLLHSGARVCGGSDFPVEEADPRLGLHAAVLRQDLAGKPAGGFVPEQRLSVGEAIRAFTSEAAYAGFAESQLGQVEAGRPGDLTVLRGRIELDPALPPPRDLATRPVVLTLIDGRVAYDEQARGAPGLAERVRPARAKGAPPLRKRGRQLARLAGSQSGG